VPSAFAYGWFLPVPLAIANYYVTTFSVWFGHWLAHGPSSPTRRFHIEGHHAIYPSSGHARDTPGAYHGGQGATNSAWALLPWLVVQAGVEALALPTWAFALCLAEMALLLVVINHVHEQFHVARSRLERFRWFLRARAVHDLHHDRPLNLMVADHFWDRVFRTFESPGFDPPRAA
jgi:hypothetical protein